jgi:hypothetical protein
MIDAVSDILSVCPLGFYARKVEGRRSIMTSLVLRPLNRTPDHHPLHIGSSPFFFFVRLFFQSRVL